MANRFTAAWNALTGQGETAADDLGAELFDLDDAIDVDADDMGIEKRDGVTGKPIGSTAQTVSEGYVSPDERDPRMIGAQRFDEFNRMIQDFTIVAASVRLTLNLIAKAVWNVTPPTDEDDKPLPGGEELADLLKSMMDDIEGSTWSRTVRRVAMFIFMGFTLHETTMKLRDDGHITIGRIGHRPQKTISRWDIKDDVILGVWQRQANGQEVYIPRDKLIYAVDDSLTDHPEGQGLLRHIRRATKRLKGYEELEEVGFENDLRGIPVARIPMSEIDAKASKMAKDGQAWANRIRAPFLKFIQGHVRNKKQGMLLNSETYRGMDDARSPSAVPKWAVELLQGESTTSDAIANAIKRLREEIALALGTEHLLTGTDGKGSMALSKTKSGSFYMTIISALGEIVAVMKSDWRDQIWEANGWPEDLKPDLAVEEIRDEDVEEITNALANMARAGATFSWDDPAILEVLDMLGLSRPNVEDKINEADLALRGNQPPVPAIPVIEE